MTDQDQATHPEVADLGEFTAAWQAWHAGQEARLADPHGFLAITSLHWLTETPQRFGDAPGAWHTGGRRDRRAGRRRCSSPRRFPSLRWRHKPTLPP